MYLVTDPHHPVSHLVLHTLHTRRQPTLTTCPTHPTPITAAFLTCPDTPTPTTDLRALAHHTRHIVYLATTTPPDPLEDLITRLTPTWTLLHPGPPASHALRWTPLLRTGHLPTPRTHKPCPLVHEADLADVAVAALTEPHRHTHRTYDLTGPHHLTEADQIRILAQVLALPAPPGPTTHPHTNPSPPSNASWAAPPAPSASGPPTTPPTCADPLRPSTGPPRTVRAPPLHRTDGAGTATDTTAMPPSGTTHARAQRTPGPPAHPSTPHSGRTDAHDPGRHAHPTRTADHRMEGVRPHRTRRTPTRAGPRTDDRRRPARNTPTRTEHITRTLTHARQSQAGDDHTHERTPVRLSDRGRLHRTPHTTPAAPPLIELRDVSLTHDRTTLVDHLDLTVHENEHVALIGLTTTATTALAHLLTGRTTPTHGRVTTHTPAQHFTPHPHHTLAQAITGHPNPSPLDPHLPPTLAATGLDPRDLHTPLARLDHRLLTHIHHARTHYALRTGTRLFIHTTDPTPTRTPHTGHLLITPQPTHARSADRILLLVQGRVTETGTHRQLLLRGGAYARLYALHRHTG